MALSESIINLGTATWALTNASMNAGKLVLQQNALATTLLDLKKISNTDRLNVVVTFETLVRSRFSPTTFMLLRVKQSIDGTDKYTYYNVPLIADSSTEAGVNTYLTSLDVDLTNYEDYLEVQLSFTSEVAATINDCAVKTALIAGDGSQITGVPTNPEVVDMMTKYVAVKDLSVTNLDVENLEASQAKIVNLIATIATIGKLSASILDVNLLDANRANIEELFAQTIYAVTGKFETLEVAKTLTTSILDAYKITTDQITANNAAFGKLDASLAEVKQLMAQVGQFDIINASKIFTNFITAGAANFQDLTVLNAFITDAMIQELTANKINAGSINTSLVDLSSEDGTLLIFDNLIQVIYDNVVRVEIGMYAADKYGIIVRGADGQTVLMDETGVKDAGITLGAIRDHHVAGNANINGDKLDIDSVVTEINVNSNVLMSSSKVNIDEVGQTLDLVFTTLVTLNKLDESLGPVETETQLLRTELDIINGAIQAAISEITTTDEFQSFLICSVDGDWLVFQNDCATDNAGFLMFEGDVSDSIIVVNEKAYNFAASVNGMISVVKDNTTGLGILEVRQTEFEQTSQDFRLSIISSGTINMLKNSVGLNSTDKWTCLGSVGITALADTISGNGFYITDTSSIAQDLTVIPGAQYTLSFKVKSTTKQMFVNLVQNTVVTVLSSTIDATSVWQELIITFVPTASTVTIKLGITKEHATDNASISDIIVNRGDLPHSWVANANEIFTVGFKFNEDGMRVSNTNISTTTIIDANSFRVEDINQVPIITVSGSKTILTETEITSDMTVGKIKSMVKSNGLDIVYVD